MKTLIITLTLVASFSAAARSSIKFDSMTLKNCGGELEVRSKLTAQAQQVLSVRFVKIQHCAQISLSSGEKYKISDKHGKIKREAEIYLTNNSVDMSFEKPYLTINLKSKSGQVNEAILLDCSDDGLCVFRTPGKSRIFTPSEW